MDYSGYREMVIRFHDQVPADVGGVIYEGGVDWIAQAIEDGLERGTDVRYVAGQAMFRCVTGHPFFDGNHRTAGLLAYWILERGGYVLTATESEFARFDKRIDAETLTLVEVVAWLRKNTRRSTEAGRRMSGGRA